MKRIVVPTAQLTTIALPTTKLTQRGPQPAEVCKSEKSKDILYMVDSTVNVTEAVLQRIRNFISYSMARFHQLDESLMMGVMQFSDANSAKVVRKVTSYSSARDVEKVLRGMKPQRGFKRLTGDALIEASKTFYEVNTNHRRYEVQDVIILLTDGNANDQEKVRQEVDLLKARNIKIIVISIGDRRFKVDQKWNEIVNATYLFTTTLLPSSFGLLFDYIWRPICSEVYYRKNYPPASFRCDGRAHDIYLTIDGSASIKYGNFKNVQKLLQDLIILLTRQNNNLHIGMMQYSEIQKTEKVLKLGKHTTEEILDTVQSMSYHAGRRTDTGNALSRVSTEVFNKYSGDRPLVDDTLILFTDGNAHDLRLAHEMADAMKSRNIKILGVAAGKEKQIEKFRGELEAMVTKKEDIISVDFPDLATYATKLLRVTCDKL